MRIIKITWNWHAFNGIQIRDKAEVGVDGCTSIEKDIHEGFYQVWYGGKKMLKIYNPNVVEYDLQAEND